MDGELNLISNHKLLGNTCLVHDAPHVHTNKNHKVGPMPVGYQTAHCTTNRLDR